MYRNLRQALQDLERAGMLKRIHDEVDPYLEMAEIARQAYECGGPALLFEKVKGCRFQAAANIFGTMERMKFLFRDTLKSTKTAIDFKSDPVKFFKGAGVATLVRAAKAGLNSLPERSGSIRDFEECTLADLPQIVGWPEDGGAFITLPQVATRPCEKGGILKTNLGMYRVQISGNSYAPDECGLHYQINRDIAAHHQKAIEEGRPLKVSIFIGGSPAHAVAAVTPMPANLSELTLAGMLAGRRFRYFEHDGYLVSSDAEFCILGEMAPDLKPEGPFGDHVGYYSGCHDFPYLKVKKVLCKKNAIYPFTVVGRPPKEDTVFGKFIHEITRPMVPTSLPGVHAVHAVDEAGVHPLCLALGSERFRPYTGEDGREPMELLKTANALLGFNQVSLAKYLMIAAREDDPALDVNDVPGFFAHVLERVDFARDLHLQTATTIDTLDYSGTSLNHGSKLVIAAAGKKRRELRCDENDLASLALPEKFGNPRIAMKGVLAVQWKGGSTHTPADFDSLRESFARWEFRENYPWVSVVDPVGLNGAGYAGNVADFLWMTFTRSDPAQDLHGVSERFTDKHWAIDAPLIVDARIKAHHQKPLAIDEGIVRKAKKFLGCLALAAAVMGGSAPDANAAGHCATAQILEHLRHTSTAKVSARKDVDGCGPEAFYDSVYTRITPHFQIFYTLEGVHATTEKYIDSAAVDFEKAWELHVGKRGMRAPESDSISHHYQKKAEKGHYIVEVVDLLKVRDRYSVMGNECGGGCFGITHPADDPHKTQIFIENDFKYSTDKGNTASIDVDGTTCYYDVSETPITTYTTELVDYSREWAKAIRVTAFHELYHAVQLRYINYNQFSTFWLEGSAAGVEEIAAPDVNDYIHYIGNMFSNAGGSLETTSSYDAGLLYIYLYNHFSQDFDKKIWEGFAKDPSKNFTSQFTDVVKAKKMSADSVFHDFAERLSFSGTRSSFIDTSAWIGIDQPLWPDAKMYSSSGASPSLRNTSYQFYSGSELNLDNFVGKASALQYKGGHVTFFPVVNTASLDSIQVLASRNDSTVWILSRLNQSNYIPEAVKDSTLRAFPTPWRRGNLCFTPLPPNKKFIEIRNARGDLVMREKYTHTTHCIDGDVVKSKMKPGVYRFRAGASGKTEKFLIVY